MKKSISFLAMAMILISVSFTSCEKDEPQQANTTIVEEPKNEEPTTNVYDIQGTWYREEFAGQLSSNYIQFYLVVEYSTGNILEYRCMDNFINSTGIKMPYLYTYEDTYIFEGTQFGYVNTRLHSGSVEWVNPTRIIYSDWYWVKTKDRYGKDVDYQ